MTSAGESVSRKWYSGMLKTEDWWAVWLGLALFLAGLGTIWGVDIVGWMTKLKTWEFTQVMNDLSWSKLMKASGKAYAGWHPLASLFMTWLVFTALTTLGAWFMGLNVTRFFLGWTVIFFLTWALWIIGHEAHFKAHKTAESITAAQVWGDDIYCLTKVNKCSKELKAALKDMGADPLKPTPEQAAAAVEKAKHAVRLSWGLQLGGGFSFMLALAVGLIIGNFIKPVAEFLKEAAKPEWFIKTAIVYLGIKLGHLSLKSSSFTFELLLAGAAATFVAYLLFWPIVYWLGRKPFRLPRDASAVLASGISICGVSAAIATAGAIRAKPVLATVVSMLIVIFAMLELIVLPGFYTAAFPDQPIVNGAALGMTVKTDGADAAAGAILEELMKARHYQETGQLWGAGILESAIVTKIWIDVFIGVWAFVLAIMWMKYVERTPGQPRVGASEIWFRFPKFVIGYFIAWFTYLAIALFWPELGKAADAGAKIVQSPMRKMMFMLTFVAIGVITDFSKLKGMGRLAVLYAIALFLIIAPIALVVAYIFHRGMMPLPAGG